MEQAFKDAAAKVQVLASEKQTTANGAEIMTLTYTGGILGQVMGHQPRQDQQQPLQGAEASADHHHQAAEGEEVQDDEGPEISFDDVRFDFFHAAQTGDAAQLRLILDMKIDVNIVDADGYPALTLASCYGHAEAVATLLDSPDIDFDMMASDGCTALQVAAQDGFGSITHLLVEKKADIDLAPKGAAAPLFLAAQEGHVHIVEFLAEAKADVDRTRQSYTPLFIAAQEGHAEVVRSLLYFGATIDVQAENGSTPLYIASQKGHFEAVRQLVAGGAALNLQKRDSSSPLLISLLNGHTNITYHLVDNHADVNLSFHDGSTPLMAAAYGGDIQTIVHLVKAGANLDDVNEAGDSATSIFRHKYGGDLPAMIKRRALAASEHVRQNMKKAIAASKQRERTSVATSGGSTETYITVGPEQQPSRTDETPSKNAPKINSVAQAAMNLKNAQGEVIVKTRPQSKCTIS